MSNPVLVTGALGTLGSRVVAQLALDGHEVVAVVRAAPGDPRLQALPPTVRVRHADLTRREEVFTVVSEERPRAVVHLAAVVPPGCYADPARTRAANTSATGHLVDAIADLDRPCRIVHASSISVHGSRNPHTMSPLTASSPIAPADVYGASKAAGELLVMGAAHEWVVLRVGTVTYPELASERDADSQFMAGILAGDARIHTVHAHDAAQAFVRAIDADCAGEILLIGGDESCRMTHNEMIADLTAAVGLAGVVPPCPPGDPGDDDAWYIGDWLDTSRSQEVLGYQQHSWPAFLEEVRRDLGARRHVLRALAPLLRVASRVTNRRPSGTAYAAPWKAIEQRWGSEVLVHRQPSDNERNDS